MHPRILAFAVLAALSAPAYAATYTPTRFDDPLPNGCQATDCSLREAVMAAEATLASDTIALSAGTYQLTRTFGTEAQSWDLDVTRPLLITGSSAGTTIVNGTAAAAQARVFDVVGAKLTLQRVGLRGGSVGSENGGCLRATGGWIHLDRSSVALCTAANGSAASIHDATLQITGASIYRNAGSAIALSVSTLQLQGARIFDNVGDRGGGVYVHGNAFSRIQSTGASAIEANEAQMGGGIMMEWGSDVEIAGPTGGWLVIGTNEAINGGGLLGGMGTVTLANVALIDNVASGVGGGMWVSGIDATRVRAEGNTAYVGGGAYVGCGGGLDPCRIAQSSFAANVATDGGGGIWHSSGTVFNLENVSSYGNSAQRGGGILTTGSTRLTHVTSWQDTAALGPSLLHDGGSLLASTLRNSALLGGCAAINGATLISDGGNAQVAGTPTCSLTAASDKPALTAAQVGASYGDFGGGMQVVGISGSSSLVNAGLASWCGPLDVRSYLRPASCDIGAFEAGVAAP